MPTLTVKNIPYDLYARLKQRSVLNQRSLNSEVIACIKQSLRMHRIQPEAAILKARLLREKTARYPITEAEFNQAKVAGRQ